MSAVLGTGSALTETDAIPTICLGIDALLANILVELLPMCAVSTSDFPSNDVVRRRLQHFQKSFVSNVSRLFTTLPLDTRLSTLALAIRAVTDESHYARVTLADFLQTTSTATTRLPADFLEQCVSGRTEFVPCVPDALFPGITHARQNKVYQLHLVYARGLTSPSTWLKLEHVAWCLVYSFR